MGSHLDNYKKLNEWITKPLSLKLKKIKEKKIFYTIWLSGKKFQQFFNGLWPLFFFLTFLG